MRLSPSGCEAAARPPSAVRGLYCVPPSAGLSPGVLRAIAAGRLSGRLSSRRPYCLEAARLSALAAWGYMGFLCLLCLFLSRFCPFLSN